MEEASGEVNWIPTAQTLLAVTTATPLKPLLKVPTLGLLTTLQLVPFQCSISVCTALLMPPEDPTAQMSLAATTATPLKLFEVGSTLGLLTTFQLVPFQCSISVCPAPDPTAQISEAATTATAFKLLEEVPTLGL